MTSKHWPLAAVAALLFLLAAAADAQEAARPIAVPPASAARLHLREVVRLGSLDGEHDAFGRVMDVALDGRGRILVADDRNHRVVVFSREGRYVGSVGRRGHGPGEFQSPWRLAVDASDSIFVWDMAQARVSVFGPDLRFARSFSLPPRWTVNSLSFLPDGRLLVAAYARGAEGPLHVVSREGRVERTFGPRIDPPDLAGFESSLLGGSADVTPDGIVYSVKSPYEIWFFDHAGQLRRRCAGRPEWTTAPAAVVQVREEGAALEWRRFVHSSRVIALGDGLLLNQVVSGERSHVDVLTDDCRLLRRTVLAPATVLHARTGSRLVGQRMGDHPQVVVVDHRVVRD